MANLAIKPTKRDVLRATLDEASRRLHKEALEKRGQANKLWRQMTELDTAIIDAAKKGGDVRHAGILNRLRRALADYPSAVVHSTAELTRDNNGQYKPSDPIKYRIYISGNVVDEANTVVPTSVLADLAEQGQQLMVERKQLEQEAYALEHKSRNYAATDLLNDLVLRLPDTATQHLDALIEMIQKVQEEPLL